MLPSSASFYANLLRTREKTLRRWYFTTAAELLERMASVERQLVREKEAHKATRQQVRLSQGQARLYFSSVQESDTWHPWVNQVQRITGG